MASRPSANQRAVRVLTAEGGTTTQPSRPHHDGRPRRDRPLYSGHAGREYSVFYGRVTGFLELLAECCFMAG